MKGRGEEKGKGNLKGRIGKEREGREWEGKGGKRRGMGACTHWDYRKLAPMPQVINAATKQQRLERSKRLLRRLSVTACKRVFFTDEKVFYSNAPVSTENDRV